MLDLNEVRMFVQVVRAHSFAEAARRLNIPANTLSRRIRRLEASLETRLLQRTTRKLTLTDAGQAFLQRCEVAIDAVMAAGKELLDGSGEPGGSVRIAAPADFLDLFHLDWIAEFLLEFPRVRLDFILSDARADLIAEGIDVAFRGGTAQDTDTIYRQLSSQFFGLAASPDYLASRGVPATLADLADHDCLTASGPSGRATWKLRGPQGEEEVSVSGRFAANSARSLLRSSVAGFGIALLPNMLTLPELRAGRLVRVLEPYRRDGADFNIVLPSTLYIPPAVNAFVEFAMGKLRSLGEGVEY